LETYQEKSLKKGLRSLKAKAKARRLKRINLPVVDMIQEMIPAVAQKALMERRVVVRMNLKTILERLDNYHQVRRSGNK